MLLIFWSGWVLDMIYIEIYEVYSLQSFRLSIETCLKSVELWTLVNGLGFSLYIV